MTFPRLVFAVETVATRGAEPLAASAELRPASERAAGTVRLTMLTFMSTPLDLLFAYLNTEERRRWDCRIAAFYDLLKLVAAVGFVRVSVERRAAVCGKSGSAGPSFCRLGPSRWGRRNGTP